MTYRTPGYHNFLDNVASGIAVAMVVILAIFGFILAFS